MKLRALLTENKFGRFTNDDIPDLAERIVLSPRKLKEHIRKLTKLGWLGKNPENKLQYQLHSFYKVAREFDDNGDVLPTLQTQVIDDNLLFSITWKNISTLKAAFLQIAEQQFIKNEKDRIKNLDRYGDKKSIWNKKIQKRERKKERIERAEFSRNVLNSLRYKSVRKRRYENVPVDSTSRSHRAIACRFLSPKLGIDHSTISRYRKMIETHEFLKKGSSYLYRKEVFPMLKDLHQDSMESLNLKIRLEARDPHDMGYFFKSNNGHTICWFTTLVQSFNTNLIKRIRLNPKYCLPTTYKQAKDYLRSIIRETKSKLVLSKEIIEEFLSEIQTNTYKSFLKAFKSMCLSKSLYRETNSSYSLNNNLNYSLNNTIDSLSYNSLPPY